MSGKTFYLVAVGGTAMAPLAALLVERGERVLGSDLLPLYPPMSDRIAALGIEVRPGFASANVPGEADVVVGNLAGRDNPELVEAQRRGLRVRSMPQALHDEFLLGRHPVVIAGTHGKTTTSALTAWLLAAGGHGPGYLVGGEPRNFPSPSAIGTGPAFVLEGDEYSTSWDDKGPKFLHYAPRTFVLTSVEFDHADLYADIDAVKAAFRKGLAIVPAGGLVVANGDDPNVRDVLDAATVDALLYSTGGSGRASARLAAEEIDERPDGVRFDVVENGSLLLRAVSPLAGLHNVGNALAAIGAARPFGLSGETLAAGLSSFRGVARRLDEKGTAAGVTVVDDFAHHPTAVAVTLAGARKRYAGRRLWAAFEPRSMTAGRADFGPAYEDALAHADGVALARPFHAARLGRAGGPGAFDEEVLCTRLRGRGIEAFAGADPAALAGGLLERLAPGDVVVVMSSGAFGGLCGRLLSGLAARSS